MKYIILFLFLNRFLYAQQKVALHLDPISARGGTAAQIFDTVNYIPLENTKESTFGSIQNLQVSDSYFVFFDSETKAIYVFNKNGKFVGKISTLPTKASGFDDYKHSADSYFLLRSFVLDKASQNIYIAYIENDKATSLHLAIYSPKGILLKSKRLSSSLSNLQPSFAFLDGDKEIFEYKSIDTVAKSYFCIVQGFDSIIANVVPRQLQSDVPIGKRGIYWPNLKSLSGRNSLWTRLYPDCEVYFIDQLGVDTIYKFVFPAHLSLDPSFYKDTAIRYNFDKMREYFGTHRENITSLESLFRLKTLFAFSLGKAFSYSVNDSYLFSLKSATLYAMDKITSDSSSFLMPVTSYIDGADDAGFLYLNIPSYQMFSAKENDDTKLWRHNAALATYFKTQSRKSNPVIVQLKPKDNL